METIRVNSRDIEPFRVSHFNMLKEKFFSLKSKQDKFPSIEEALNRTLAKKIVPGERGDLLTNLILMAHVAYLTKGNLRIAVHGFNIRHWIFQLYVPQEDCRVLSSTVVSDWDSLIKKEYPNLEYVSLEDFWNLFSTNQIRYEEEKYLSFYKIANG